MPLSSQNPVISCLFKIQTGFAFLVLAYPGCPGKEEVVKRVYWQYEFYCWVLVGVRQLKGLPANEVDDEVDRMLSDLGLEDKRQARVRTLSGGMKRKLSVGIAFVGGSEVCHCSRVFWTELKLGRGMDLPWKSQSEWQRTEINGGSMSMVWPTLGSTTVTEQNVVSEIWHKGNNTCLLGVRCLMKKGWVQAIDFVVTGWKFFWLQMHVIRWCVCVTVLGKLFTPIVPLFNKQWNW